MRGTPKPPEGVLKHFLLKGEKRVRVLDRPERGAQTAETRYRTLEARGDVSLVECELITGARTRFARKWRTPGIPCWATGNMATRPGTAQWAAASRRYTLCGWNFPRICPARSRRFPGALSR